MTRIAQPVIRELMRAAWRERLTSHLGPASARRYRLGARWVATLCWAGWMGGATLLPAQVTIDTGFVPIGQLAPDFSLPHIINFPRSSAHRSDFAGKPIILDFWATYCSPCVGAMPDVVALQRQFAGKVQFMLVGPEDDSTVRAFYERKAQLRLPTALGADFYGALAARLGVPSLGVYVWIDAHGTVRAVTDHEQVTPERIQALVDGKPLDLPLVLGYGAPAKLDGQAPFLLGDNGAGAASLMQYHSLLTGALPGANGFQTTTAQGPYKGRRFFAVNLSIRELYRCAYSQGFLRYSYVRTRLEVPDTSRYAGLTSATSYCYELIVPPERAGQLQMLMRQDLDRYFLTTGRIERRRARVYVLTLTGPGTVALPPLEPIDPRYAAVGFPQGDGHMRIPGSYFYTLQELLEDMLRTPVVDETGVTGTVDLGYTYNELPNELKGVDAYRRVLAKYGLGLVEAERDVDFLVIREQPHVQVDIPADSLHPTSR